MAVQERIHLLVHYVLHLKKGDDKSKHYFTFQATLHKNGTIVFFYKDLPIPFAQIDDQDHPVKVGLSDAYVREHQVICK